MEQPAVANQLNFHGNGGYLSKKFAFMKFLKDDPNMRVGFEPPSLLYYQVRRLLELLQIMLLLQLIVLC
jgi:hypothetical protein